MRVGERISLRSFFREAIAEDIIALRRAVRSALIIFALWPALAAAAGEAPLEASRVRSACLNALGKRSGAIAVMDVASGRVLACVPEGACAQKHPPGSAAKLATAHAGLMSGVISEDTVFDCRGAIRVAGRIRHCSVPGGHGRLSPGDALAQSCNIWFCQAGRRIGRRAILRSWELLGGAVQTGTCRTVPVERLAAAGEGIRVSPLEMAAICRTIALKRNDPESPCRILAAGMEAAVLRGTARALAGLQARPACKTGSPQHSTDPLKRHGWLVGYAPRDRPQIAFAVFCREGNAYSSAVPVAERMLRELFPRGPGQRR